MTEERQATEEESALQRKVESLAREIAEVINSGQAEGRDVVREFAVNLVRDQVQVIDSHAAMATGESSTLSPLAIAIPFLMMGAVLVLLFPLIGLAMFAAAALMIVWGVLATLFARKQ